MRLLILGYEFIPLGGGTAQSLHQLLEAWSQEPDWEIEVWTAQLPKGLVRPKAANYRLIELPCGKKALHYWTVWEQIRLLFKAWRRTLRDEPPPEVILVWGGWPLGILLLGAFQGVPAVMALRGSDVPGFNPRTSGPLWRMLARAVWEKAARVTVNSPWLARLAKRTCPGLPVDIIPNGVYLPADLAPACDRINGADPGRSWNLLAVNRLVRRKRVDWILQALALLHHEDRRRITLRIAGDGPERPRLETAARELNLMDQVEFLGEVSREEMDRLFRKTDLMVLASEAEGHSNALLEAMSYGIPCLCATLTGFTDLDEAIIPVDRIERMTQHIRLLLHAPDLYEKHSRRCQEAVASYTWETMAERYEGLLKAAGGPRLP